MVQRQRNGVHVISQSLRLWLQQGVVRVLVDRGVKIGAFSGARELRQHGGGVSGRKCLAEDIPRVCGRLIRARSEGEAPDR